MQFDTHYRDLLQAQLESEDTPKFLEASIFSSVCNEILPLLWEYFFIKIYSKTAI